ELWTPQHFRYEMRHSLEMFRGHMREYWPQQRISRHTSIESLEKRSYPIDTAGPVIECRNIFLGHVTIMHAERGKHNFMISGCNRLLVQGESEFEGVEIKSAGSTPRLLTRIVREALCERSHSRSIAM